MPELVNEKISNLFSFLVILIIGTFCLGMLTFGEPFLFWEYPFSDLGSTVTQNGMPNTYSCFILVLGMLLSGSLLWKISVCFKEDPAIIHYQLKRYLSISAGIGCFVFVFPHNINNDIHMIGAAIMVASFWAMAALLLREVRKHIPTEKFFLQQSILQGTVLTYAAAYTMNSPIKNIAQKFAVLGLMIVLKIATSTAKTFEFSSIFTFSQKDNNS
ncbi:MAG: hypothetical protein H8D45_11710 [Bacteroidetes bacterium]|nr:hypothetical protein [Bacteroidota bacterium]